VRFYTENGRFAFLGPFLGGLGATYDDHFKLVGKHVADFLFVLIEIFSLGDAAEGLGAISVQNRRFRSNGDRFKLNDLSYGVKIWTDLSSVFHNARV